MIQNLTAYPSEPSLFVLRAARLDVEPDLDPMPPKLPNPVLLGDNREELTLLEPALLYPPGVRCLKEEDGDEERYEEPEGEPDKDDVEGR